MDSFKSSENFLPRLMDEGRITVIEELDYDWSRESDPYNEVVWPYIILTIFLYTTLGSILWIMLRRQFIQPMISNGDNLYNPIKGRLRALDWSTHSLWMAYIHIHSLAILIALGSTLIIYWIRWDLQFYSKILAALVIDGLIHGYLLQKVSMTKVTTSKSSPQ